VILQVKRGQKVWFVPLDQNSIESGTAILSQRGLTDYDSIDIRTSHHTSASIEAIDVHSTRTAAIAALRAAIKVEISNLKKFDKLLKLGYVLKKSVKRNRLRFSCTTFDSGGV